MFSSATHSPALFWGFFSQYYAHADLNFDARTRGGRRQLVAALRAFPEPSGHASGANMAWMPAKPEAWPHTEREWVRSLETASARRPGDVVAGADGETHRWDACGWPAISSWGGGATQFSVDDQGAWMAAAEHWSRMRSCMKGTAVPRPSRSARAPAPAPSSRAAQAKPTVPKKAAPAKQHAAHPTAPVASLAQVEREGEGLALANSPATSPVVQTKVEVEAVQPKTDGKRAQRPVAHVTSPPLPPRALYQQQPPAQALAAEEAAGDDDDDDDGEVEPDAAAEAVRQAAAEGLTLARTTEKTCGRQYTSSTGFRGVSRNGDSFLARVSVGGKQTALGSFTTPEEAALACARARMAAAPAMGAPAPAERASPQPQPQQPDAPPTPPREEEEPQQQPHGEKAVEAEQVADEAQQEEQQQEVQQLEEQEEGEVPAPAQQGEEEAAPPPQQQEEETEQEEQGEVDVQQPPPAPPLQQPEEEEQQQQQQQQQEQRGTDLLGRRIKIWWDGDRRWFVGTVSAYSSASGECTVSFRPRDRTSAAPCRNAASFCCIRA